MTDVAVNAYNSDGDVGVTLHFDRGIGRLCLDFETSVEWIAMPQKEALRLALSMLALVAPMMSREEATRVLKALLAMIATIQSEEQ